MKQIVEEIRLRDVMDRDDGWGKDEGEIVREQLLRHVEAQPEVQFWAVSLDGVRRTDASFPREAVVRVVRMYRGQKGFCVRHLENVDLLDNWDAAAKKLDQPLIVWSSRGGNLIGPSVSEGLRSVFEALLHQDTLTTAELAQRLNIGSPNASNKLKALYEAGYIMRRERAALSGGIEHEYFLVK